MELIILFFFGFLGYADAQPQDPYEVLMRQEAAVAPDVVVTDDPDPDTVDAPAATGRTPEPQVATGQFTTAVEVKPILDMTQGSWIAVRDYEGQDLLYFTHLLAWRCGLWEIRYGINGAPATEELAMEPCHTATSSPNAITDVDYPIYLSFPSGSIQTVTVQITYDDGSVANARYSREQILMP